MSTPAFLRRLDRETLVRLKPSPIAGVGVFALRDIQLGADCFPGIKTDVETRFVSDDELASSLAPATYKMVTDFCLPREEDATPGRYVYNSFHAMDVSYYLNHSETPNVEMWCDPNSTLCSFRAARDICAGEELLFDYRKEV